MTTTVVRIDRLVLHGLPSVDRQALAEGLARELLGLFAADAKTWQLPANPIATLQADRLPVAAGIPPEALGASVAQSVHRSLRGAHDGGSRP